MTIPTRTSQYVPTFISNVSRRGGFVGGGAVGNASLAFCSTGIEAGSCGTMSGQIMGNGGGTAGSAEKESVDCTSGDDAASSIGSISSVDTSAVPESGPASALG